MRNLVLAVAMLFAASAAQADDVLLGALITVGSGQYCSTYDAFRAVAKKAAGLQGEAANKLFANTPHCGLMKDEDVNVRDEFDLSIAGSKYVRVLMLERATGQYVLVPAADVHVIARL